MEAALAQRGLHITHSQPPSWRAPWLSSGSSSNGIGGPTAGTGDAASDKTGYPGFYPTHPGQQDEDVINESNVVRGYTSQTAVTAEGFSAHRVIYGKLQDQMGMLPALTNLISDVRKTQAANFKQTTPHTFKLPPRVTWNDQRREAWLKDLSDPATPLSKLVKNVPHGYKNEKLLDMLTTRQVPHLRAIWFIRVIGASEISSQKSRATFSEAAYTAEWTSIVCDFVKKQLAEITLPPAPTTSRPGFNIKAKLKPTLSDPEVRAKWTARFSYSVSMIVQLFHEGLLARGQVLEWLLSQAGTMHLGQLPFVVHICQLLLRPFSDSFRYGLSLNEILLDRLQECKSSAVPAPIIESVLQDCLCEMFTAAPRSFVSPKLWLSHRDILQTTLAGNASVPADSVANITSRMDNLLLATESSEGTSSQSRQIAQLISYLDEIGFPTDTANVMQQLKAAPGTTTLKLRMLLTWATTKERRGAYRKHAAAYIWKTWSDASELIGLNTTQVVVDWVDHLAETAPVDHSDVVTLVALLQSRGLFSYEGYFEHMTGRGLFSSVAATSNQSNKTAELHQELLRSLPVASTAPSFTTRRRVLLKIPISAAEESNARLSALRFVMIRALPSLPQVDNEDVSPSVQQEAQHAAFEQLAALPTRAEKERFINLWLSQAVTSLQPSKVTGLEVSFLGLVLLKLDTPAHALELSLSLLANTQEASVANASAQLLVVLREYVASVNQLQEARQALVAVSKRFQSQSTYLSPLAHARKAFIPVSLADSQPTTKNPCPTEDAHPFDLSSLEPSASPEALTQLATMTSYKFKAHPSVPYSLWKALCHKCDGATADQLAVCYRFLAELDLRLEQDLDETMAGVFQSWLAEVNSRPSEASLQLAIAAYLCGVCCLSTLIQLFMSPILQASVPSSPPGHALLSALLRAVDALFAAAPSPLVPTEYIPLEQQWLYVEASRHVLCQSSEGMHAFHAFAAALCHAEASHSGSIQEQLSNTRRGVVTSQAAQLSFQRYPNQWASICLGTDASLTPEAQLLILNSLTSLCEAFNKTDNSSAHRLGTQEILAIWRLDSTRIAMQAYLSRFERSSDHSRTAQELDGLLDKLVFEGDAVIAGDLVRYLTPKGTNQFVRLALRRIAEGLGRSEPVVFFNDTSSITAILSLVHRLKTLFSQADLTVCDGAADSETLLSLHSRWLALYGAISSPSAKVYQELHLIQALHTILFFILRLASSSSETTTFGPTEQAVAISLVHAHNRLYRQAFSPLSIMQEIEDVLLWLWRGFSDDVKAAVLAANAVEPLERLLSDDTAQEEPALVVNVHDQPFLRAYAPPLSWNVLDMPATSSWQDNVGPLSVKPLRLHGSECPAVVDRPAPLVRPASIVDLEAGDQLRFISETTSERETIWAQDVRSARGHPQAALRPSKDRLAAASASTPASAAPSSKRPGTPSKSGTAAQPQTQTSQAAVDPKSSSSSNNAAAATITTTTAAGAKRKEPSGSPDVVVVSQPQQQKAKKPKPIPRARAKKPSAAG